MSLKTEKLITLPSIKGYNNISEWISSKIFWCDSTKKNSITFFETIDQKLKTKKSEEKICEEEKTKTRLEKHELYILWKIFFIFIKEYHNKNFQKYPNTIFETYFYIEKVWKLIIFLH